MIRISIPWLFDIIESLDSLDNVKANEDILSNLISLFPVQGKLEAIFDQSIYGGYLRASRDAAFSLHSQISEIMGDHETWTERKVSEFQVISLREKKDKFKTVLLADLNVLPSYLVSMKDSFDIAILVEAGHKLFPSSLLAKAPETEKDAKEVGRALAFELATACGFHTFRVLESVVRRYWDAATSGADRPRLETLGSFATELEKLKVGDGKIIEAIKQMTKLHRNPLIHPEVILTTEEAIGIIGMARSVMAAMLQFLPDAPNTTGVPAIAESSQT
jgi:hypothetical protein